MKPALVEKPCERADDEQKSILKLKSAVEKVEEKFIKYKITKVIMDKQT